jgi:hypothetical protein
LVKTPPPGVLVAPPPVVDDAATNPVSNLIPPVVVTDDGLMLYSTILSEPLLTQVPPVKLAVEVILQISYLKLLS